MKALMLAVGLTVGTLLARPAVTAVIWAPPQNVAVDAANQAVDWTYPADVTFPAGTVVQQV